MTTIDPTRRVTLKVNGAALDTWTSIRITRGLHEICGSFELEYRDTGREAEALTDLIDATYFAPLRGGDACELAIDGEVVLRGYVERPRLRQTATAMTASAAGRDICGDLVDCAALPAGPFDFQNITLDAFARQVVAPFGIGLSVQTDVGAPLPKLALHPHDKALAAIDRFARQRSVLVVSDGVANLVLTTAGTSRAPAAIEVGVNVVEADYEEDRTHRFSDVYVRGQTAHARGNHSAPCAITPAAAPGAGSGGQPWWASATTKEKAGIVMTGHATDPEITRYRPDVRQVLTQSGASSVQEQAEWHVRVARGQSLRQSYTVLDWRAGPDGELWRPNTLVAVYDPFAEIDDDLLIAGVDYLFSEEGARTQLHLVGRTAYDRINEPARRRPRHRLKRE